MPFLPATAPGSHDRVKMLFEITRQFASTVIEWNPFRSPVSRCSRQPGAARSLGLVAASNAVSCSRSLTACCG